MLVPATWVTLAVWPSNVLIVTVSLNDVPVIVSLPEPVLIVKPLTPSVDTYFATSTTSLADVPVTLPLTTSSTPLLNVASNAGSVWVASLT